MFIDPDAAEQLSLELSFLQVSSASPTRPTLFVLVGLRALGFFLQLSHAFPSHLANAVFGHAGKVGIAHVGLWCGTSVRSHEPSDSPYLCV